MTAVPGWLWWGLLPAGLPELLAFLDRTLAPQGFERRPA